MIYVLMKFLLIILLQYIHQSFSKTNYVLGGPNNNVRIYLVNLDRRRERLERCDQQLKHLGLNYTRISAVDASVLKHNEVDKTPVLHPEVKFDLKSYMMKREDEKGNAGAVGCWLSHLQIHLMIMDDAKKGIDGPVLILEDDIFIGDNALRVINNAINVLPESWEMLVVGYKNDYCSGPVPHTTVSHKAGEKFCRARLFLDTHAYILHNSTATAHFLQYENIPGARAIDLIWVPLNENLIVETYLLKPKVIFQNKDFRSDITPEKIGHGILH